MAFQLAACAGMMWRDRPIAWRSSRLKEMGFGVGLWNWPNWDLAALERTGATFRNMNGCLQGRQPCIGAVQVTDNPGRFGPGTGQINCAGIAKTSDDMGCQGPVGKQANAKGDEEAALEAFRKAFSG